MDHVIRGSTGSLNIVQKPEWHMSILITTYNTCTEWSVQKGDLQLL